LDWSTSFESFQNLNYCLGVRNFKPLKLGIKLLHLPFSNFTIPFGIIIVEYLFTSPYSLTHFLVPSLSISKNKTRMINSRKNSYRTEITYCKIFEQELIQKAMSTVVKKLGNNSKITGSLCLENNL